MNGHEQDAICTIAGTDRDRLSPPNGLAIATIGPRARRAGLARRGRGDAGRGSQTDLLPVPSRVQSNTLGHAEPQLDEAENGSGAPAPSKPLILLATGDDRLRSTGRDYLRDQGYAVTTATGGLECTAMLRAFDPEVVVLDADLLWGGADGVLACLPSGSRSRIPIVFLAPSAGRAPGCGTAGDAPVASVLKKPVILASLLRAVRSAAGCGSSNGGAADLLVAAGCGRAR